MTAIFPIWGKIIQAQFGINEIASAITVGKSIGTVLTRPTDAKIFELLARQFQLHLTKVPEWIHDISFERTGTVLGDGQRVILSPNTLPDINWKTVEGIASFMVLILRYMEGPAGILQYLEDLLHGKYAIVHGGVLSLLGEPSREAEQLPFPTRQILQSFINGVIDADADSPQRLKCVSWLAKLAQIVGGRSFLTSATKYARAEHRRLLQCLLDHNVCSSRDTVYKFNTLSAGAATIALAALANGAKIGVQCMTQTRIFDFAEYSAQPSHVPRFVVILWLTEPPSSIAEQLLIASRTLSDRDYNRGLDGSIPLYGGRAEISPVVAQRLHCDLSPQYCSDLWQMSENEGKKACWEAVSSSKDHGLLLRLSKESLACTLPAHAATLIEGYFNVPRSDQRHLLSKKFALIFHQLHDYENYDFIDREKAHNAMNFIFVAYLVGCLRKLISNSSERLSTYCWTANFTRRGDIFRFCGRGDIYKEGVQPCDLMWMMAQIWGGSTEEYHQSWMVNQRAVGIVCPQMTFLIDVVRDPKRLATRGLTDGIFSHHIGSLPLIPRDPGSGMVLAGDTNQIVHHVIEPSQTARQATNTSEKLLITVEPNLQAGISLSLILCAWLYGDVVLQLDPVRVLRNLLVGHQTGILELEKGERKLENSTQVFVMSKKDLLSLERFSINAGSSAILEAQDNPDWQVAAAGCAEMRPSSFIMLRKEDDQNQILSFKAGTWPEEALVILCHASLTLPSWVQRMTSSAI